MNKPLWTGTDFIAALQGEVIGNIPDTISDISIDSRQLQQGNAFFAIRGPQFDGHNFVHAAVKAGAGVVVIATSHTHLYQQLNIPLVVVPDVLAALENLGRAARTRTKAKIIAITGSVGKTTSKEALRHLLKELGQVHASPASFNNHWGVPLTLARLPQQADFAIFEIGMNHSGEIRPLVKLVRPHIALISCVASVHSAYFSSIEDIARAKAEIFEGIEPGGAVLINHDDEQFDLLHHLARDAGIETITSFGENEAADYRLLSMQLHDHHTDCQFSVKEQKMQVRIGAIGHHMALNMLSCLGITDMLHQNVRQILPAMIDFIAPDGRGARHILYLDDGGHCLLLDESYNANPTSMRAALQVLANTKPTGTGRRIAVLGDMLELGETSRQAHEGLIQPLYEAAVDLVFLLGAEIHPLASLLQEQGKEVIWCETWQEIAPLVTSQLRDGDVISVKSSKSTGSSHIVTMLLEQLSRKV